MCAPQDDQLSLFDEASSALAGLHRGADTPFAATSDVDLAAPKPADAASPAVELEGNKQSLPSTLHHLPLHKVKKPTLVLKADRAGSHPRTTNGPAVVEPEDRLVSVKEVALRLGTSVPTVWRWTREREDFPKPRKVGPKSTRWRLFDLLAFARTLV